MAHLLVIILGIYNQLHAKIVCWIGYDVITAAVNAQIVQIKSMMQQLILLITWTRAYGDIALLHAEDLTVFICQRHRFNAHRFRSIQVIDRQDCYVWFGLCPNDLRRLFLSFRIPPTFVTTSRHSYGAEECFIIMLFHIIKGTPFTEMARHTFRGDPRCLSRMYQVMIVLGSPATWPISTRVLIGRVAGLPSNSNTCWTWVYPSSNVSPPPTHLVRLY
jgi:hypothetical protein